MVKKQRGAIPPAAPAIVKAPGPQVLFPDLSPKSEPLECTTLVEDQIILIDEVLSPEECRSFVRFIDSLPLELTPPKKKGEADRVNQRFSVTSASFAERLHALLLPHLPAAGFPYPASVKRSGTSPRTPHSLNSQIRVYKYTPGQYFGPHYDDSVRDSVTGAKSEWTLLIYLTGVEDGVQGGEESTLFYQPVRGKQSTAITPPLKRGMALLHRHGHTCMLHEGSPVTSGCKYVLRSDLMFVD